LIATRSPAALELERLNDDAKPGKVFGPKNLPNADASLDVLVKVVWLVVEHGISREACFNAVAGRQNHSTISIQHSTDPFLEFYELVFPMYPLFS
jgi:hypothetical protein